MITANVYNYKTYSWETLTGDSSITADINISNSPMVLIYVEVNGSNGTTLKFSFIDTTIDEFKEFTMASIDSSGTITYDIMTINQSGTYRIPIATSPTEDIMRVVVTSSDDVTIHIKSIQND